MYICSAPFLFLIKNKKEKKEKVYPNLRRRGLFLFLYAKSRYPSGKLIKGIYTSNGEAQRYVCVQGVFR